MKSNITELSLLEALNTARGIEEQLSTRYSQFAELTKNEVVCSLFTHLALECQKHSDMLKELPYLLGEAVDLPYRGDFTLRRLPEIRPVIDQQLAVETTFKIVKEHIAVEESVMRYYVELSRIISNEKAVGRIQSLIEDERSHHEMLGRLTSELTVLYGEQLTMDYDN